MTKLAKFCNRFIKWGILITLVAVPLVFSTNLFNVFTLPKLILFRSLVLLMAVAWLIEIIEEKRKDFWRVKLAVPLAIFLFIYILSTVFSIEPYRSFWGLDMQMDGFYSFIFYITFFFLVATHVKRKEQIEKIITFIIYTSLPIALYGFLQHFGIDFVNNWDTNVQRRVISTIGNPLHLGRYLAMVMPIVLIWIFYIKENKKRLILLIILFFQFFTLLFTLSRSSWLAFLSGLIVFFLLLSLKFKKKKIIAGLIVFVILFGVFIGLFLSSPDNGFIKNNTYLNRLTSSINDSSSMARFTVWKIAWEGIKDRPVLGHGPAVFFYVFNKHYIPSLAKYDLQNYQSSHNQFLDIAVANGIPGLFIFLLLIIYFFYLAIELFFKTDKRHIRYLSLISICSITVYLVQNLFVFSNPTSHIYFYLFLGLVSAQYDNKKEETQENKKSIRNATFVYIYLFLLIVGLILIIWTNILPLISNNQYHKALKSKILDEKIEFLKSAINLSGAYINPDYYGILSDNYLIFAKDFYKEGQKDQSLKYIEEAEKSSRIAREIMPMHLNLCILDASMYNLWGLNFDSEKFNDSDRSYEEAVKLAPRKLVVYWLWGSSLLDRDKKLEAEEKFQYAIDLDPDVYISYRKISEFYEEIGEKEKADLNIQKYKELRR